MPNSVPELKVKKKKSLLKTKNLIRTTKLIFHNLMTSFPPFFIEIYNQPLFFLKKAENLAHNSKMAQEVYVVERILKRKISQKGTLYLVKWKGYRMDQCTWEPQENLLYLQQEEHKDELTKFKKKRKQKGHPINKSKKFKRNPALVTHQRRVDKSREMTPTRQITFWEGKPEQTATSRKERIPQRDNLDQKINILRKFQNEQGKTCYVVKQDNKTRQMPEAQVKALFPTQLCAYYQQSIKYHILELMN